MHNDKPHTIFPSLLLCNIRQIGIATSSIFFLLLLSAPLGTLSATRSLSFGLSGDDVTAVQNQLIATGYLAKGKATGYFGPLTNTAVKKFQCDRTIVCSGSPNLGYAKSPSSN